MKNNTNDVKEVQQDQRETRLKDLHPYQLPGLDQLKKIRITNFRDVSVIRVKELLDCNLVNEELSRHDNLLSTVKQIYKNEFTRNINNFIRGVSLDMADKIFTLLAKVVNPIQIYNIDNIEDNKVVKYVRLEAFLPVYTSINSEGTAITHNNYVRMLNQLLTTSTLAFWFGTHILLRNRTIYILLEELAEFSATIFIHKNNIRQESIIVLTHFLVYIETLIEQFDEIKNTKENYDENISNAKNDLIKLRASIQEKLLSIQSESSIAISGLLRHAHSDERYMFLSQVHKCHTNPSLSQQYYFDSVDMIYHRGLNYDINIYLPDIFENNITDAKVLKLLFLDKKVSIVQFSDSVINMFCYAGDLLHSYFVATKGVKTQHAEMLKQVTTSNFESESCHYAGLFLSIASTVQMLIKLIDVLKARHKYQNNLKEIHDKFHKSIYSLSKNSAKGISLISTIPDIISNLENAYSKFTKSAEKCASGLSPVLAAEHISVLNTLNSAINAYLERKDAFIGNYSKCYLSTRNTDITFQHFQSIILSSGSSGSGDDDDEKK